MVWCPPPPEGAARCACAVFQPVDGVVANGEGVVRKVLRLLAEPGMPEAGTVLAGWVHEPNKSVERTMSRMARMVYGEVALRGPWVSNNPP